MAGAAPEQGLGSTPPRGNGLIGIAPVAFAAALFAWFLGFLPEISAGERLVWSIDWVPSLGFRPALSFSTVSLTFG